MTTLTVQLTTLTLSVLSCVHVVKSKHLKTYFSCVSLLSDWTCPCWQLFSLVYQILLMNMSLWVRVYKTDYMSMRMSIWVWVYGYEYMGMSIWVWVYDYLEEQRIILVSTKESSLDSVVVVDSLDIEQLLDSAFCCHNKPWDEEGTVGACKVVHREVDK